MDAINKRNNFYLTIVESIKNGIKISEICKKLNISKQVICYYMKHLKRLGVIEKRGYGTWNLCELYESKVKNFIIESSPVTSRGITTGQKAFKKLLIKKGLNKCVICKKKNIHLHHINPVSFGGTNEVFNLIPLCKDHHKEIHARGTCNKYNEEMSKFYEELKRDIKVEVRGHAFMWKVKVPKRIDWKVLLETKGLKYTIVNGNTPRIVLKNKKIWLGKDNIIIYDLESYFGGSSIESKKYAIERLLDVLCALEQELGLSLKVEGGYVFTVSRNHYSLIKNCLAIQCNKEGKKIYVHNDKGVWFCIDNSYNLDEAETLHPQTALPDNLGIQKYFNEHKETNFQVTPKFIIESISKLTNNQIQQAIQIGEYTKQIKSHLKLINEYRKENVSWRKNEIIKITKTFSNQKRLSEYG